jgi:hypothetical protein
MTEQNPNGFAQWQTKADAMSDDCLASLQLIFHSCQDFYACV